MPQVSIIIPTLQRPKELRECLESLWAQTYQDFEIIKICEEGPLAALRNKGAKKARGKYLVFIDDDTVCSREWLQSIVDTLSAYSNIAGVSGPATITERFRHGRDLFRYPLLKCLYDAVFLEGRHNLPGHITRAGAWTTGAANAGCSYEGEVDFLEACNMAFRKYVFLNVGGFDEAYKGVGDWSEPDLAFRIRCAGYGLWFSRNARMEHRPSRTGAFKKRGADSPNRLANYELFASRWIEPCWRHSLYKWFLRTYYAIKAAE